MIGRPAAPGPSPTPSSPPSVTPTATPNDVAGNWTTYHHDAARSGVATGVRALGSVRRAWNSPALDGLVYAEPLIVGARVIADRQRNRIEAQLFARVRHGGVHRIDDVRAVRGRTRRLKVSGSDITVAWRHPAGAEPSIVAGGAVWSLGYDGLLVALDPRTGTEQFRLRLRQPPSRFESVAAAGDHIFVPDRDRIDALAVG